jgi:outer membrane lipoprotein SlyB
MKRPLVAAVVLAALAGCTTTNPNVVNYYEAQQMSTVLDGVVVSTRPVVIEGSQSGLGAAAGGMVGAIAGSSAGHPYSNEAAIASVIGAVIGGMLGNAAERTGTREEAVELLVQLRNGERRAIVQAVVGEPLIVGDSVIIVTSGGRTRVTKAPAVVPTGVPPPATPQS